MLRLGDVQGRIYKFKSYAECFDLGLPDLCIPHIVRVHLVLVLDLVPEELNYVEVMTVRLYTSMIIATVQKLHF